MKKDIMATVRELQDKCFVNWRLNTTFLVLIPNKEGEKGVSNFIPISLIHGVYKILMKSLANRLATVMDVIISANQTTAVKGR